MKTKTEHRLVGFSKGTRVIFITANGKALWADVVGDEFTDDEGKIRVKLEYYLPTRDGVKKHRASPEIDRVGIPELNISIGDKS